MPRRSTPSLGTPVLPTGSDKPTGAITLLCVSLGIVIFWFVYAAFGLDNRSTLELTLFSWAIIAAAPATASALYAGWYFKTIMGNSGSHGEIASRNRQGRSVRNGISGAFAFAAVPAFFVYPLASTLPQHFGREIQLVSATTLSLNQDPRARAVCQTFLNVQISSGESDEVCLSTSGFRNTFLADFEPIPGELLTLSIRRGVFGAAVIHIDRRSASREAK